jgi:hypothetical protein
LSAASGAIRIYGLAPGRWSGMLADMAKVDLDLVKFILQRNELDTRQVAQILEDLRQEMAMLQAEQPPAPRVKKQHVILVSDPEGTLSGRELVGWVVQVPEEESPLTVEERIFRAGYDFNATPKGRRTPVRTVGEACEAVPARFFKEQQTWVKTREPVLVLRTGNRIPREAPGRDRDAGADADNTQPGRAGTKTTTPA